MRAGYISSFLAILFLFVFLIFPSGTAFSDTPPNTENTHTTSSKPIGSDTGYLARIIQSAKEGLILLRDRTRFVGTGFRDLPKDLPHAYKRLSGDGGQRNLLIRLATLFIIGFVSQWLFFRLTLKTRNRLETSQISDWREKAVRILLRSLLDVGSVAVFVVATQAVFWPFLNRGIFDETIMTVYVVAFLIVSATQLIMRILLSPSGPSLRILPFDDLPARYLNRWIIVIASVAGFGWLTCGLFNLLGISKAAHLLLVAMVGLVISLIIVYLVIRNREAVAKVIQSDRLSSGFHQKAARNWHKLAAGYVLLLWFVWLICLLIVGERTVIPAVVSLLSVPLFFLFDWMLQKALDFTFGIAAAARLAPSDLENEAEKSRPAVNKEASGEYVLGTSRIREGLRHSVRILLAVFLIFFVIDLWGIDLPIGKTMGRTALSILVVILICYVLWEITNAAIQRKLQQEMPDIDEDMEAGGSGGSRIGTLLLLMRKFLLITLTVISVMIVLSALGVNIGPLIAGAGVIGLAIGFGAQTLVRDIISGIFYLFDDAFRVGDYVETAGIKGMVEHISLRSIKLRHPRGMVHTIPFGDMGFITNFSRDYIITKLDVRVRYDTDIEKVRKIVKQIDKSLQEDNEFRSVLLGKVKSQGIREMDDAALTIRIKFKTFPGKQFVLRREIFHRIQEAFQENGIAFARRNVTVYMPPEENSPNEGVSKQTNKKPLVASAAAAMDSENDGDK
jgi:small-conductance mechanosensitive channel